MQRSINDTQAPLLRASSFALAAAYLFFIVSSALFIAADLRVPTYASSAILICAASAYTALSFMEGKINIGATLAAQCALWYILPLSYAWAIAPLWFQDTIDTAIRVNFFVALSTFVIFLASEALGPTHKIHSTGLPDPMVAIVAGLLSTGLIVYLMATGEWGYRIGDFETENRQSIALALTTGTGLAIAPLCAYVIGAIKTRAGRATRQVLALACIALFHVYAWIPMQRRQLAIMLLLILLAYLSARYRHKMSLTVLIRAAVGFIVLVPIIYAMWQVFFQIRVMSYSLSAGETISVSKFFSDSSAYVGDTSADFQDNLLERPFITKSVDTVYHTQLEYLYGEHLYTSFIGALPSALFPWKNMILFYAGGVGEGLWTVKGMIPFDDYSNTIFLDSIVDFGYFGPFIYFAIFVLFLFGLCILTTRLKDQTWSVFFFYMLCVFSVSIEASPTALFVFGRNALIAMGVFYVVCKVFGQRLSRRAGSLPRRNVVRTGG
ncbi:hypothetical protein [Aliirhizobium smilacinae]|uniref:Uncharacterized protein n=1 Tax=Aliirhizobium smilacinae TaxID=1395944 RepID=A0A5C4XRU4_9HYPH|nr:hypothetical protein [Rhizobium smilacinae]TNM65314.1 hypothetical protein FHP24_03285 [Rhizobium smilacinae]